MTRKFERGARIKVLDTFTGDAVRGYTGTIKQRRGLDRDAWEVLIDNDPIGRADMPWGITEKHMELLDPEPDTEKTLTLDRDFLRDVLDEMEPGTDSWTKLDSLVNAPVTQRFEVEVTHQDPFKYLDNMLNHSVGGPSGAVVKITRIEG